MATVYYNGFFTVRLASTGIRVNVTSATLTAYNFTASTSLGTVSVSSDGIVVDGSFTATAGDIVRFSHATYPLVFYRRLNATLKGAQADPYNIDPTYTLENLATVPASNVADIWLADKDNPTVAPILIGRGATGTSVKIPVQSAVAKNFRLFPKSTLTEVSYVVPGTNPTNYQDLSVPALGSTGSLISGTIDCSANPNYPSAVLGDNYKVSVAGKIGGASGKTVAVGDLVIASAANAGGTEASVGTSWFVLQHQVIGPVGLIGSTNCSANPNYPAASKGAMYFVTNAGKIGGASGKVVRINEFYLAIADNAGGTEASVGTSWVTIYHQVIGTDVQAYHINLATLSLIGIADKVPYHNGTDFSSFTATSLSRQFMSYTDRLDWRSDLGLAIGSDVQAYDADLATIAGLTATTDNFIVAVSSAWASRTPAQVRTTLGLVIGTNVQAYHINLATLAGIGIADKVPYHNGTDFSSFTASSMSRQFMSYTDRADWRSDLGLELAVDVVPMSYLDTDAALTANSNAKVPTQAAVKSYVDAISQGLLVKQAVRAATTANITLSGAQTIDGVSVIAGDRVLVKDQSTGSQNGIYVAAAGAWSRSTDADTSAEVKAGTFAFVNEGTTNADTGWVLTTNDPITLATTALVFAQFSGAGQITAGNALTKTGNTLDVAVDGSTIEINSDALRLKDGGTTLAKMANMATASLLGRNTAGTGVPEVLPASTVRSLLALVPGTDVQAYDADLATLAGLTATTDNFIVGVASAWASRTPAQVRTTLNVANGATANSPDATLLARANHTGTQLAATISDFSTAVVSASPAGSIFEFLTDRTTHGTTEETFYTADVLAGTLATNGDRIVGRFTGTSGSNSNDKEVHINFAGTTILSTLYSANIYDWVAEFEIIRVSSSSVRCSTNFMSGAGAIDPLPNQITITGLSLNSTDYTIDLTGTTASLAGDLTARSGRGEKIKAATVVSPVNWSNIWAFYESDSYSQSDGSTITTNWTDGSGNARHMSVTGSPTFETSELNGLGVVRLPGSSYFSPPNMSALTAGAMFKVLKVNDTSTDGGDTLGTGLSGSYGVYPYSVDSKLYDSFGSTVRKNTITAVTPTTAWHVLYCFSAASDWSLYQNWSLASHTTSNTVDFHSTPKIGYNGAAYHKADIAAIYFLSAKPSDKTVRQAAAYIAQKWGV